MGIKLSEMKDVKFEEKVEDKDVNAKTLNDTYNDLKDCSKDELMNKLFDQVAKQKSNGTFNINEIKENMERIRSYLPQETYENMLRILETL